MSVLAVCPHCREHVELTRDGRIVTHVHPLMGRRVCPGSQQRPEAAK